MTQDVIKKIEGIKIIPLWYYTMRQKQRLWQMRSAEEAYRVRR